MSAKADDRLMRNIEFRNHLVLYYDAIRFETREHSLNGINNLHYLILLLVLFDFHNTLFGEEFGKSKRESLDHRAEILFRPYYEITNSINTIR